MPEMNRRLFLRASAGVAAAGMLAGASTITWQDLHRAARERPLAADERTLVIVTLYGGNDGVNTLIPYADGAYHDARPELVYSEREVLHLDSQLGLNPALTGLENLWQSNKLAIIRGVGYPKPDHSHFRSMDIWQTASPRDPVPTGWIGRWLDSTGSDPIRAVNIGAVLPPLAIGAHTTAAALATGSLTHNGYDHTIEQLGHADSTDTQVMAYVRQSYHDTRVADATFRPITATPSHLTKQATAKARNENQLATQLKVVGECIKAGAPTKVYSVQLSGFDTHADERATQQRLLQTFDEAVSAFLADIAADPHGRNTVVMAYSEFGRRVRANASHGTDHGTAGPVFIAGGPVLGGFYGDEPSLTDLDNGDLKVTTDFRDIYSDLMLDVIGADPTPAVGTGRRHLGFVAR